MDAKVAMLIYKAIQMTLQNHELRYQNLNQIDGAVLPKNKTRHVLQRYFKIQMLTLGG